MEKPCLLLIILLGLLFYLSNKDKNIDLTVHEIKCEKGVDDNNICNGKESRAAALRIVIWPETGKGTMQVLDNRGDWFVSLSDLEKCNAIDSRNWQCIQGDTTSVWTEFRMREGVYTRAVISTEDVNPKPSHRGLVGLSYWFWYLFAYTKASA